MAINIQNPASLDVSKANPRSTLYITQDSSAVITPDTDPDGSIRITFTPGDSEAHIELKTSGVYNDTGFRVASSSLSLGRDLKVSAVGGFMETFNISEIDDHIKALIPHIQFNVNGTIGSAHMPVLDKREDFIVFPAPSTSEIIGTSIGQIFSAIPTRVLHSTTHTVGSVGSTQDIVLSYYKGTDNTGSLLHRSNIRSNFMVMNQPITIVFDSDFGFENATNIFFEFTSTANISLTKNATGNIITTQNGHTLDELDVMLDEFVLSSDLSFIFDSNLNFVIHNRFN